VTIERLNQFDLVQTKLGRNVAFRLDMGPDDSLLLTAADLEQLRHLIDTLVPHAHNERPADPDAHVLFASVCCASQLYRCSALVDGLPSKPIVSQGETSCRECGAELGVEAF
jgi:hypothetical protein